MASSTAARWILRCSMVELGFQQQE
jgi:hypothetical protein